MKTNLPASFGLIFLAATFPLVAQTNVFPSSGNVGIGTTVPAAKLEVRGDELRIRSIVSKTDITGRGLLRLTSDDTVGTNNLEMLFTLQGAAAGGSRYGQIQVGDNGYYWGAMVLNPQGGNVGIGTTTPVAKLDIAGNAHIGSGNDNMANTPKGLSVQDDSSSPVALAVGRSIGRSAGLIWYDSGATGSAVLYTFGYAAPLTLTAASVSILANNNTCLFAAPSGNVGIGTTAPTHKLAVNGTIRAKEVIVDTGWSDYVFADNYRLAPLSEVETHIKAERHLPGIPSAQEVAEHGVSMGEMQSKLLAKIEELTLHQIAQEKRLNEQSARLKQQATQLGTQSTRLHRLEQENATLRRTR